MKIMGIVNVTPDSFSDGGLNLEAFDALGAIAEMVEYAVDYIDIGAESSRPGSKRVEAQTQIDRMTPLVQELKRHCWLNKKISIDTYLPEVAEYFLNLGVQMINDITGFEKNELIDICCSHDCEIVVMHMRGNPETMQNHTEYTDVVDEVASFLLERVENCVARGIKQDKIWIDPGIGFGKKFDDNIRLIKNIDKIKSRVGAKVLLGTSRKSFINECLTQKVDARKRDAGTMATTIYSLLKGVDMVRVHNVSQNRQALEVFLQINNMAV